MFLVACESNEMKIAAEAAHILNLYNRCYEAEDYVGFQSVLDTATLARLDELFLTALSEDENKLNALLENNQNKFINTYYTYLIRYGYGSNENMKNEAGALSFLIRNKYFGNDLTQATFDKIDHFKENSIWGFVVDSTFHDTKILSRILYKKEADEMKFSLIYRMSLINKRLFEAQYSTEDIKSIIKEYYRPKRGEVEIRNFNELIKTVNASANF
jgi:hypothetical protein